MEGTRSRITRLLDAEPTSLQRLSGGSKKGVYRITFSPGSSLVAYVWDRSENYWPEAEDDEPFTDASGEELFLSGHETLTSLGLRTIQIVARETGLAIVEDLPGESLERQLRQGTPQGAQALPQLREQLETLHGARSDRIGKVSGPLLESQTCEQLAYARARRHFVEAKRRRPELPDALLDVLDECLSQVQPRSAGHSLIHGELGPDHVRLDKHGSPVLIDIEGLMHFDVEWEHAFMAFRFGQAYRQLARTDLDPARLRLYTLCLRLSLIAGPLRLLDTEFPDRDGMLAIVKSNVQAALELARSRPFEPRRPLS